MNEASEQTSKPRLRWLRIVVNLIVCAAILGAAIYAIIIINSTEPTAQKINATRKSSALVETIVVNRGTYSPRIVVLGTVESAQRISLSPQVGGQVTSISREFVPGGMVKEGELLLEIDPADFENALSISKSELEQANASMEIEEARQRLAKKELKLLEGSIDETNRGLVLREPQIASIKAEVSAAKAAVDRAELNLSRTKIYAPFDAQVLTRSANVGSQVRQGDDLGQLVGLDEYWIMAAIPVRHLRWVQFPELKQNASDGMSSGSSSQKLSLEYRNVGSDVVLRNPDAWGEGVTRHAQVSRMIGTLDERTRLARVLVTVEDPLGIVSELPPLILDTLVETEIRGKPIRDVFRLSRSLVRDNDTVWVMQDKKLSIREAIVVFQDAEYAYIRSGLEEGDEVVVTTLATVAEGIGLRKSDSDSKETSQ